MRPERLPLGVLDAWMSARARKDADGHRRGVCESVRWQEGYERVAEIVQAHPGARWVSVADREAGILELMQQTYGLGDTADWPKMKPSYWSKWKKKPCSAKYRFICRRVLDGKAAK